MAGLTSHLRAMMRHASAFRETEVVITRISQKAGVNCSPSDTRHVTLVTYPVISNQ
jgi:hypothetical protein